MRDETSELIRFENAEQYGKKSARVHRWPGRQSSASARFDYGSVQGLGGS